MVKEGVEAVIAPILLAILAPMIVLIGSAISYKISKEKYEADRFRDMLKDALDEAQSFDSACMQLAKSTNSDSVVMSEFGSSCTNHYAGKGNLKIFTIQGSADLNVVESGIGSLPSNKPSCKCAYCDTLNDHETGVCDRCGAPLP